MNRLSFGANGNDSIQQDVPFLVEFSNSPRSGAHTQAELQNVACRRASDPTEAERLQMISRGPVLPIKNTQDVKCDSPDSTPITTPDPSAIGNNTSTLGSSSPVNLAGAGAENVMAHTAWLDAKTLRVEPGANLPKIVKAVPKGTTIVLAPGEYKQTASIRVSTDQISLIAECDIEGRPLGAVIITGDAADIPKGPLLNVSSPSGSIRDLTLHLTGVEKVPRDESAKLRPVMVSCVAVTKQSNASFVGLDITSPNARGFEIRSRATPSVSRCTIRDTIIGIGIADDAAPIVEGCVLGVCASLSVQVSGNTRGEVTNCIFESAGDACICAGGESKTRLAHNKVLDTNGCGAIVGECAQVTLEGNVIDGNHVNGIQVGHRARPTVRGNIIEGSKGSGIVVYDKAAGLYVNNKVSRCTLACVGVRDKAEPHLLGNTIFDGSGSGVVSVGSAEFVMEGNTVSGHAGAGMKVQGMSKPLVDGNRFCNNLAYGVWVQDESSVTLQNNTMEGNIKVGLLVSHLAEPFVSNNTIKDNKHTGVILQNFAGGEFRDNQICNNGANVQLLNGCNALFEGNTIRGAPGGGVLFRNETTCTLRKNMISDNGFANLAVMHSANPTVENNDIRNGSERGIHIHCEARGFYSGNRVTRNGTQGIFIGGKAAPAVTRNHVEANGGCGIMVSREAGGRVVDNRLQGNKYDSVQTAESATTELSGNQALPVPRIGPLCPPHAGRLSNSDSFVMIQNPFAKAAGLCIGDGSRGRRSSLIGTPTVY